MKIPSKQNLLHSNVYRTNPKDFAMFNERIIITSEVQFLIGCLFDEEILKINPQNNRSKIVFNGSLIYEEILK